MPNNFNMFGMQQRPSFLSFSGVITDIRISENRGRYDSCSHIVTVENEAGNTANFLMSPQTFVADQTTLYESLPVTVFYNGNAAAPLIYPPQFTADVIVPQAEDRMVFVGWFNNVLMSSDQSLRLNVSPSTVVVTENNQTFFGNPGGHVLVVFYSQSTRSIPAQTTPEKIVVLCGY